MREIQVAVDNFVADTGICLVLISREDSPNIHCYINKDNEVTRVMIERNEGVVIHLNDPKAGTIRE